MTDILTSTQDMDQRISAIEKGTALVRPHSKWGGLPDDGGGTDPGPKRKSYGLTYYLNFNWHYSSHYDNGYYFGSNTIGDTFEQDPDTGRYFLATERNVYPGLHFYCTYFAKGSANSGGGTNPDRWAVLSCLSTEKYTPLDLAISTGKGNNGYNLPVTDEQKANCLPNAPLRPGYPGFFGPSRITIGYLTDTITNYSPGSDESGGSELTPNLAPGTDTNGDHVTAIPDHRRLLGVTVWQKTNDGVAMEVNTFGPPYFFIEVSKDGLIELVTTQAAMYGSTKYYLDTMLDHDDTNTADPGIYRWIKPAQGYLIEGPPDVYTVDDQRTALSGGISNARRIPHSDDTGDVFIRDVMYEVTNIVHDSFGKLNDVELGLQLQSMFALNTVTSYGQESEADYNIRVNNGYLLAYEENGYYNNAANAAGYVDRTDGLYVPSGLSMYNGGNQDYHEFAGPPHPMFWENYGHYTGPGTDNPNNPGVWYIGGAGPGGDVRPYTFSSPLVQDASYPVELSTSHSYASWQSLDGAAVDPVYTPNDHTIYIFRSTLWLQAKDASNNDRAQQMMNSSSFSGFLVNPGYTNYGT